MNFLNCFKFHNVKRTFIYYLLLLFYFFTFTVVNIIYKILIKRIVYETETNTVN